MALLKVHTYPDPILRKKCSPVEEITDDIRVLLSDMADTMYNAPGIGLAAPQVGVSKRLIVVDAGDDETTGIKGSLYKLVNPEITESEGSAESFEGCLCLPTIQNTVKRAERILLKALDQDGNSVEVEAQGLLAYCFQHEIDHLNGILIIDNLSRLKKEMIKAKLKKMKREEK